MCRNLKEYQKLPDVPCHKNVSIIMETGRENKEYFRKAGLGILRLRKSVFGKNGDDTETEKCCQKGDIDISDK